MKSIRIPHEADDTDSVSNGYYYFAYGADLSLERMSRNFSSAQYVGRATVSNYRWIINDHGTANIIYSPGNSVQGLVYSLSTKDAETLDEVKGSRGFYAKRRISVELWEAPDALYGRTPGNLMDDGANKILIRADLRGQSIREYPPQIDSDVLVYVSDDSKKGTPSTKYADTINAGIRDAIMLGMTDEYVQREVRQFVPKYTAISRGRAIAWKDQLDTWRERNTSPLRYEPETRIIPKFIPRNEIESFDWHVTKRPDYSRWVEKYEPAPEYVLVNKQPGRGRTATKVFIEQEPKRGREIQIIVGKDRHRSKSRRPSKHITFGDWMKPKVSVVVDRRKRR
jgi:gamma-glutamylcyclotransferase